MQAWGVWKKRWFPFNLHFFLVSSTWLDRFWWPKSILLQSTWPPFSFHYGLKRTKLSFPPRFFTEIPFLQVFPPTTCTVQWKFYFLFFGHRINGSCWFHLVSLSHPTVADKIVGLKSIAAYRSGLGINTNVTRNEAQEGLAEVLKGEDHDLRWISILLLYSPQIFSNLVCFYSWQSCSYHR